MDNAKVTADPIEYPTVTLGGESYEVKFRAGDIIRLKKEHGIDIGNIEPVKGAEAMERTVALFWAGISHQVQKTVEQVADMVTLADIPAVAEAINQSLKKALPQTVPAKSEPTIQ